MKISEFVEILSSTGLEVWHDHVDTETGEKNPNKEYIAWFSPTTTNFHADNVTYAKIANFEVELWCPERTPSTERKLEAVLDDADMVWEIFGQGWTESEDYWVTQYSVSCVMED